MREKSSPFLKKMSVVFKDLGFKDSSDMEERVGLSKTPPFLFYK